jgi:hypothetical protein
MIYEKVTIDGEEITLSAEEDAEIKVWVNGEVFLSIPVVYEGQLTIHLTAAGVAALEAEKELRHEDIGELKFEEND